MVVNKEQQRVGPISTFEDLEVWQKGRELRKDLSQLVKRFPSSEKFRLADQILRASRSVTANIAEGYGRFHYQENIQFCRQARGSLFELLDHLTVVYDEGYIDEEKFGAFRKQVFEVIRTLNGYIKYLKQRKGDDVN
ncbi:MAG: four helix bundle protein [Bacillota bacterium]|jgi:four helix bundle protein